MRRYCAKLVFTFLSVAFSLAAGQNRALMYDPRRNLVLLVLGERGDEGKASVYALRYRHASARFFSAAR